MVTAKDLQYRPLAPGQEYDFLPLQGRLIDTVPQLGKLGSQQIPVGKISLRRPANFLDLALMRIGAVELDAYKLEGGERAKRAFIYATWGNSFFTGDMNLVHNNSVTFVYDALDQLLGNGVCELPEEWTYRNGVLVPNNNAAIPQEWPTFTLDDSFNTHILHKEAKEHRWWRAAFRDEREVHHSYVGAAFAAGSVMGLYFIAFFQFRE